MGEPCRAGNATVSFWNYVPHNGNRPPAWEIGPLIAAVHNTPLPEQQPTFRRLQPVLYARRRLARIAAERTVTSAEIALMADKLDEAALLWEKVEAATPTGPGFWPPIASPRLATSTKIWCIGWSTSLMPRRWSEQSATGRTTRGT